MNEEQKQAFNRLLALMSDLVAMMPVTFREPLIKEAQGLIAVINPPEKPAE